MPRSLPAAVFDPPASTPPILLTPHPPRPQPPTSPPCRCAIATMAGRRTARPDSSARTPCIASEPVGCYNARMNTSLKITKIGNSAGVILPKEVLAHLGASAGQELSLVVTPRGIGLSSSDPDFEEQMKAARSDHDPAQARAQGIGEVGDRRWRIAGPGCSMPSRSPRMPNSWPNMAGPTGSGTKAASPARWRARATLPVADWRCPDAAALAAAYAFGIARNHPFVDGNKRTAAVVAETVPRAQWPPAEGERCRTRCDVRRPRRGRADRRRARALAADPHRGRLIGRAGQRRQKTLSYNLSDMHYPVR